MNTNAGMLVQPHVNIDLAAYFSEGDQAMYIFLAVWLLCSFYLSDIEAVAGLLFPTCASSFIRNCCSFFTWVPMHLFAFERLKRVEKNNELHKALQKAICEFTL